MKPERRTLPTMRLRIGIDLGGTKTEIIALDVERFRRNLFKEKKASATVKNILELLRRIINYGVNNNLCKAISFTIKMPPVDNEKTEELTPDQLSNLLNVIDEEIQKGK